MIIKFPIYNGQRYYQIHYRYILEIFKQFSGIQIIFENISEDLNDVSFRCSIEEKQVIFAFSDDGTKFEDCLDSLIYCIKDIPIFKFHYNDCSKFSNNVIPFTPVSFYDWKEYHKFKSCINYAPKGDIILNNQRPYGGALQRRNFVHKILINEYKSNVDMTITDQKIFWMKGNNCLVYVHVPGYCNNMIDRAQLQMMSFGVCTISPRLPETLAYGYQFISDFHYVECDNEYHNLIEKIEWVRNNREKAFEIGRNAKQLFEKVGTPNVLCNWIFEKCGV